MCSNYLLDTYPCKLDTVDVLDRIEVEEGGKQYYISSKDNLKPFLKNGRCTFYKQPTKEFLLEMIWTQLLTKTKKDKQKKCKCSPFYREKNG